MRVHKFWLCIVLLSLSLVVGAAPEETNRTPLSIEKQCQGKELRASQLSGQNLEGNCYAQSDLSYSDLEGANLKRVNFKGTNLKGANLLKTNLAEAIDWQEARFCDTELPPNFKEYRNRDCQALALEEADKNLCTTEGQVAVRKPLIKAEPLTKLKLEYPPLVVTNNVTGKVVETIPIMVMTYIDTQGKVACAHIFRSSGTIEFDTISRQAVEKMLFKPAGNPEPVMTKLLVPIRFQKY